MPEVVMRMVRVATGEPSPIDGQFLKAFNVDAHGGLGEAVFTPDPAEALRFPDPAEALRFPDTAAALAAWRRQSRVLPWRADGGPNRPLTAFMMSIEPVPEVGHA